MRRWRGDELKIENDNARKPGTRDAKTQTKNVRKPKSTGAKTQTKNAKTRMKPKAAHKPRADPGSRPAMPGGHSRVMHPGRFQRRGRSRTSRAGECTLCERARANTGNGPCTAGRFVNRPYGEKRRSCIVGAVHERPARGNVRPAPSSFGTLLQICSIPPSLRDSKAWNVARFPRVRISLFPKGG